jgi:NTE family protein
MRPRDSALAAGSGCGCVANFRLGLDLIILTAYSRRTSTSADYRTKFMIDAQPGQAPARRPEDCGQVSLVLQGGGALGAYQGGVYQAMHERGMEPDWIIGTSIGAINAALIAGNAPDNRLSALKKFWLRVQQTPATAAAGAVAWAFPQNPFATPETISTFLNGVQGFFEPNVAALVSGPQADLGPDKASYYSAEPLRNSLRELVSLDWLNKNAPRITVGATNVKLGEMRYFDSRDRLVGLEHILASGALPPALPPVEVDGEYYWDGGVVSNTPLEAVFDDEMRQSGLVFTVQVWNRRGDIPQSILQVLNREKDIHYASRTESQILRQKQIHKLRHIITELTSRLTGEQHSDGAVAELSAYGCLTQMHIILLQAPSLAHETYLKDIDFTEKGIQARWEAGYRDTTALLERAPWLEPCDPLEGVILHQFPPVTLSGL